MPIFTFALWVAYFKTEQQFARSITIDKKQRRESDNRGCMDPDTNVCKARFSRDTYLDTAVDPETRTLRHIFLCHMT